ncbi:MAG: prepilin cleavage protein [Legionella longbeachae]|nr:prepilin cleavage protein [Legionella longbeachae]
MNRQMGISLSEVLISLLLASIMMTLLIQLYLNSKNQYIAAEKILSVGFDLQWVSDLMSDSFRRAGFTPCLGIDQLLVVDRRSNLEPIHALQIENQPHQLIQVNRMNEHFTKIIKIESATEILVENPVVLQRKRPIMIADCAHAEVHSLFSVARQANGSLITLDKPLYFSYDKSAYLGEYLAERWFIRKNAKGNNTLHYQSIQTEEVSPLIHSLHIKNQRVHNKQFLEIMLGLDEGKTQKLMVAVRGP